MIFVTHRLHSKYALLCTLIVIKCGICQKYCCPFKRSKNDCCSCNHKNSNNGKRTRSCTEHVTLLDGRDCISFKKFYTLRTEAVRYNSRFESTGQERLGIHDINPARNRNSIAHIALLATAIVAVVT